ncbi:MAG: Pyridoxine/pyridoxamine 5'-phosphate oxidase [Flavobacteriia bacterium]|nr:MAG: Pyridoxine/pyridoxamine 5'-phosphate oxidase [Flavobacteriia bacterium]
MKDLSDQRKNYEWGQLMEGDLKSHPMDQFDHWFEEYRPVCSGEVNAMMLSTMGAMGATARVVLLKMYDPSGFVFFSNYESRKGGELLKDDRAGLLFFWQELQRQVRVQGRVQRLSEEESTAYFSSRPRTSQLGAWASHQSQVIKDREELESGFEKLKMEFEGKDIKKPNNWGGYRLQPERMEFWQGRSSRLHDRLEYYRAENTWKVRRLAP